MKGAVRQKVMYTKLLNFGTEEVKAKIHGGEDRGKQGGLKDT